MLSVKNLKTYFFIDEGTVHAVDDVSFSIKQGTSLGLVGESGCGKSVTALSILRLVEEPPGKTISGSINFNGQDILSISEREMRKIRGKDISMIFQEPMTSLNPVFTIGNQMVEVIMLHEKLNKADASKKAIQMLNAVKIPDAEKRFHNYPHQLSGGMLQRVMIAMAISCNPSLLIADEPTTALDVTIQAQILKLLADLKDSYQLALLLITHDLGIIAEVADRVAVMYAGIIVEEGDVADIFRNPCHPYTIGLMNSVPRIDDDSTGKDHLSTITGTIPNPLELVAGCPFEPRCSWKIPLCSHKKPEAYGEDEYRYVRCFLYEDGELTSKINSGTAN